MKRPVERVRDRVVKVLRRAGQWSDGYDPAETDGDSSASGS
ncbi:MAG: hypothetical protein U1E73_13700 [Planctomycetota bacterium]